MTIDIYSHFLDEMKNKPTDLLEATLENIL